MNDTPRVTVPVEPTERLAQYVKGPSPYRAWRGAPPEGEPTLKGDIAAMLSAAPAPEGGAVLDAQTVTLEWTKVETTALEEWHAEFGDYAARVVLGHDNVWSYRVNNSGHLGFASADEAKAQALSALRKRLSARLNDARATVALYDTALATREEAPTEAGELVWFDVRDVPQDGTSILLNHRTHGIIQGWFSKGEWSDDTPISPREYSGDMWILGDDLYQDEVEFGEGGVVLPSGVLGWLPLSALRAQPPAREDAQPVAWRMIGRDGSTISLQAEPYHGGFAHMMAADVGCTVQPLYTHPAPDALRVAVEALEAINHIRSEMVGVPVDSEAANAWAMALDAAADHARQALAALQAEQKGGA